MMRYERIKSRRYRNVSMRIKDGKLIVTSPSRTSKAFVENFIRSHQQWINKHMREYADIPRIHNGDTVWLLESPYKVCQSNTCSIEDEIIYLNGNEKAWQALLKEIAQEKITPRFRQWEKAMGYSHSSIRYGYYSSKWGSCRKDTKSFSFNTKLVFMDWEEVDSVIVHELCHMKFSNHSHQFYDEVERWMPNYWQVHKRLIHRPIPILDIV